MKRQKKLLEAFLWLLAAFLLVACIYVWAVGNEMSLAPFFYKRNTRVALTNTPVTITELQPSEVKEIRDYQTDCTFYQIEFEVTNVGLYEVSLEGYDFAIKRGGLSDEKLYLQYNSVESEYSLRPVLPLGATATVTSVYYTSEPDGMHGKTMQLVFDEYTTKKILAQVTLP